MGLRIGMFNPLANRHDALDIPDLRSAAAVGFPQSYGVRVQSMPA